MRHNLATICTLGALLLCASHAGAEDQRTIRVRGEGKATSPPDMAVVMTGVVTMAPTASDALAANNDAMQGILDVVKQSRIAAKDVQTSSFNVQPEYERDERGRTKPNIVGYRVTNQVRIRVRDLANLGKVLDALVDAGSNQVSGISFGIDYPTGVMNQARSRAISDARSRANLYAQAAGVRVGKVLTISEQPIAMPQPRFMADTFAAEARVASVPIATGEQELSTSVDVVFALEGGE
jgi:uncharacterized protein YggE